MNAIWIPVVGEAVQWTGEPCPIEGVVCDVKYDEHNILVALVRWEESTNQGTEWVGVASLDSAEGRND